MNNERKKNLKNIIKMTYNHNFIIMFVLKMKKKIM